MISLLAFKSFFGLERGYNTYVSVIDRIQEPTDETLQLCLDSSTDTIKDMLGLMDSEDLPDAPRIDRAVYLLAKYFYESRNFQETTDTLDFGELIKSQKVSYFRSQVYPALMRQLVGMISKYRKHARFIPTIDEAVST